MSSQPSWLTVFRRTFCSDASSRVFRSSDHAELGLHLCRDIGSDAHRPDIRRRRAPVRLTTTSISVSAISSRMAWTTAIDGSRSSSDAPGSSVSAVRQRTGGRPSFVSTRSTRRSATTRAVVYFTPTTDKHAGTPGVRVIDDARVAQQRHAAVRRRGGNDAAVDQRHLVRFQPQQRKRRVDLREEGIDFIALRVLVVGRAPRRDSLVPISVRPCHGSRISARPARVGATSAALRAGRDVTRFIAFSSGHRVWMPRPRGWRRSRVRRH